MCTRPVQINRFNRLAGVVKSSGIQYVSQPGLDCFVARPQLDKVHGFLRDSMLVPCGKCIECLKKRQNDLALRAAREANKRGSMHFLTLTYDNEHLPLQICLEQINKETGEVLYPYPSSPLVRFSDSPETLEFVSICRFELERLALSPFARVITKPFFEDDLYIYQYTITPSLYRRDVRLWLKRCRVRYKREFGESLPDFSYVVCGEYGPRTCRPHYHLAFFGLERKHVQYLRDNWSFGSITDLRTVNAVNPDGSNGFEIAAKYIGKYMSKGKFECDSVKCGLSEKPRLMLSRGVGVELSEHLISYYRCYDIFGKYDIQQLVNPKTGKRFTDFELLSLASECRKRSFVSLGSYKYCLPRNFIYQIWYIYDKTKCSFRASEIRLVMSALTNCNPLADFTRKLLKSRPGISSSEFVSEVAEFVAISENSGIAKEKAGEASLASFYSKSIF